VGRTIASFRIAAEIEKTKWRIFRSLLDKEDKKKFDEMFSYSRLYNPACMNACGPVLIHPNLMCIVFEHYRQLKKTLTDENGNF
jgi:hypothetical protein